MDIFQVFLELNQNTYTYRRSTVMNKSHRLKRQLTYDQELNKLDSTKYFSTYSHDTFIVTLLRQLEPFNYHHNQTLLKADS